MTQMTAWLQSVAWLSDLRVCLMMMIGMTIDVAENSGWALRAAALGALVFDVLYVVHRLLQGLGPDDAAPARVLAFNVAHRSALLASEVVVGLALLAVIVFIAAFASLTRQAGRDTLATAVTVSGAAFVAVGFISQAAETALVGVADAGDRSAVLALNHLQGRIPIVWTITALTGTVSLAAVRTRLLPTWLGVVGLVTSGVFALGSMSSVLGRTVEGNSSLVGSGLFIVWLLLVAGCLWQAAGTAAPESEAEHQK
jgi:hypothetical protein